MNLGRFRELTRNLPDDYEIVLTPGDATWWMSAGHVDILHAVADMPGVVSLAENQEVTEDYFIPLRLGLDD